MHLQIRCGPRHQLCCSLSCDLRHVQLGASVSFCLKWARQWLPLRWLWE